MGDKSGILCNYCSKGTALLGMIGKKLASAALAAGVGAVAAVPVTTGTALIASSQTPPPAARSQPGAGILLALGDSLAAGYQPTDGTRPPPVDPASGWPDAGYPDGYAADVATHEHLSLVDLGCPGETTASFDTRPAEGVCATWYRRELGAANQQAAALAELRRHPGAVHLVTFDLGANDLDACLAGGSVDAACLATKTAVVLSRLPRLLARIETVLAAEDPRARLVAMDYYDPFLGFEEDPGGTHGSELAALSLGALEGFDASLRALYRHAGAAVAAVSSEFQTASALPLTPYGGRSLPRDVALVCRWTYMCPLSGTGGAAGHQDIHPDTAGYARIAAAFEEAIGTGRGAG